MYHHFTGKQELAVTALEASAAAMRSDVEALLDVKRPAMERLIAYLERQRDSLRGCRMGRLRACVRRKFVHRGSRRARSLVMSNESEFIRALETQLFPTEFSKL